MLCFRKRAMIILFSPELLRPHSEGNPGKLEHVRGREGTGRLVTGLETMPYKELSRLIWMLENWGHFR